ncbi:hypothetical protein ACLMJK_002830 [Lecanora helva]
MSLPGAVRGEGPPQITTKISPPELYRIPRKPVTERLANKTDPSTMRANVYVTTDEASPEETKPVGSDPCIKWDFSWKTPSLIVLWALVGFSCAIGHHLYYQSLDGTKAGSSPRQSWAVRFGTAFAFLVVASLRAACDIVYISNKLFSVTSDPTAFMSWEFIRHAKIAFLVAMVCWCIPLADITPPATLSVVSGFNNDSRPLSLASLDWNSSKFFDEENFIAQPSSDVLQIATLAAQSMAIIPPAPPAANSSFHIQFCGPTLECSIANSSEQPNSDYYAKALAKSYPLAATRDLYESGKLRWGDDGPSSPSAPLMNIYSAFSPYAGQTEIPPGSAGGVVLPNWTSDSRNFTTQQLWIQTSDKGLVCIMGNASFDVDFEFVDAALTVAEYSISMFEPFWMPLEGQDLFGKEPNDFANLPDFFWSPSKSYMAVYLAFSSLLNGNVSTTLTGMLDDNDLPKTPSDGIVTIHDGSSRILQHGLSACDEFVHSFWNGDNAIGIGQDGPVPWRQAATKLYSLGDGWSLGDQTFTNITNNLFTKPSWMCRNRTLLRAIEDLANNITISMLSSPNLVKPNATTVPLPTFPIQNIYRYDSRNLVLSYSISALLTILCAYVGFFALHYNGVAHSTAFSAIIATTRNRELDEVSRGHSSGALPLGYTGMKVRFGVLVEEGEKGLGVWGEV